MSAKSSILLSASQEHWYLNQSTGEIILEFGPKNRVYKEEQGFEVRIPEGSDLWVRIAELLEWPETQIKEAKDYFLY